MRWRKWAGHLSRDFSQRRSRWPVAYVTGKQYVVTREAQDGPIYRGRHAATGMQMSTQKPGLVAGGQGGHYKHRAQSPPAGGMCLLSSLFSNNPKPERSQMSIISGQIAAGAVDCGTATSPDAAAHGNMGPYRHQVEQKPDREQALLSGLRLIHDRRRQGHGGLWEGTVLESQWAAGHWAPVSDPAR